MKYQYVIAGLQVLSNEPVFGLNLQGDADTITTLHIGAPPTASISDCYLFPNKETPFAYIQRDGRVIWLTQPNAVMLRQVAPFAAALQGKITFHGAAVCYQAHVYAFIGESGAGKSTLARAFAKQGVTVVADDLLACRDVAEQIITLDGQQPLAAIYFLRRDDASTSLQFSALTKKQALQKLIVHGFGELHIPAVWGAQFTFYHKVVDRLPLFDLVVPDSLEQLPAVVDGLMTFWQVTL